MTDDCSRIQETLIASGPTAFQKNKQAREHLADCRFCFAFLESLQELDQHLAQDTVAKPSSLLVQKTLSSVLNEAGLSFDQKTTVPGAEITPAADVKPAERDTVPETRAESFRLLTRISAVVAKLMRPVIGIVAKGAAGLFGFFQKMRFLFFSMPAGRRMLFAGSSFAAVLVLLILSVSVLVRDSAKQVFPESQSLPMRSIFEKKAVDKVRETSRPGRLENLSTDDWEIGVPDPMPTEEMLELDATAEVPTASGKARQNPQSVASPSESREGERTGAGEKSKRNEFRDLRPSLPEAQRSEPAAKSEMAQTDLQKSKPKSRRVSPGRLSRSQKKIPSKKPAFKMRRKNSAFRRDGMDRLSSSLESVEAAASVQDDGVSGEAEAKEAVPKISRAIGLSRFFSKGKEKSDQTESNQPLSVEEAIPVKRDASDLDAGEQPAMVADELVVLRDEVSRVGQTGVEPPVLVKRVFPKTPPRARGLSLTGKVVLSGLFGKDGAIREIQVLRGLGEGRFGFEAAAVEALKQYEFLAAKVNGRPADVRMDVAIDFTNPSITRQAGLGADDDLSEAETSAEARTRAELFLADRRKFIDLNFVESSGYWSNSYIPGDPALRLLESRLRDVDKSQWTAPNQPMLLENRAQPYYQAFDAPTNAAVGLFLHADRNGAEGARRMVLQVGLQGAKSGGGRRPAMNLGLVYDLEPSLDPEVAAGFVSLLDAFREQRDFSDRFSLTVAGRPGGLMIAPDSFRHGPIRIAQGRLFEGKKAPAAAELNLIEALRSAAETVGNQNDPSAPLGSKAIILVTSRVLGSMNALEAICHRLGVAGIQVSVIAIGPKVDQGQLDRLVLAGQGNRRSLLRADEAEDVVKREMASVSRAVARALRLRIRLAAGVRLVEVLGSHRLNEQRAERVRQAEKSIDLKLSRSMGIEADRGEDEEGIQIVIPAFYAGDSHVILLDLYVPGAGPVADVSLRFKDLIFLRNGLVRASLNLNRQPLPEGPLERQVLKNVIAVRLSQTLAEAGDLLAVDDPSTAFQKIDDFRLLLEGLRVLVPGFQQDPGILKDLKMLTEYTIVLAPENRARFRYWPQLIDSLQLAGYAKLLPRQERE